MNYFHSKVQEIQPFKTNTDAMVTAIALPSTCTFVQGSKKVGITLAYQDKKIFT